MTENGHHGKTVYGGGDVVTCDFKSGEFGGVALEGGLGKASREVFGKVTYVVEARARLVASD